MRTDLCEKSNILRRAENLREELCTLLDFKELPLKKEIDNRANSIYNLVMKTLLELKIEGTEELISFNDDIGEFEVDEIELKKKGIKFMIGGAPFFMKELEEELSYIGIPVYAFSRRESVEEVVDGKVVKRSVFKHLGFVEKY